MFPFLPLPSDFDPLDDKAWQTLLQKIESQLVQILDSPGKWRTVMCEFFWMAYMAVHPTFPFGDWPNWDPRIPLEGNFVLYWMAQLDLPYVIVCYEQSAYLGEIDCTHTPFLPSTTHLILASID